MKSRSPSRTPLRLLLASAVLLLAACGGGDGEAPPAAAGSPADTTGPVVTITDNVLGATATGDVLFSFGFNENVGTSFTVDDVVVSGGTKGAFTRINGTSATLVVVPTPNTTGTVGVSVGANAVQDARGNGNAVTTAQQGYDTVLLTQMSLPVSFNAVDIGYGLVGFGGAEASTIVTDPTDAANKVARVVRAAGAEVFAGTTITDTRGGVQRGFSPKIPFNTTDTRMSVRVWSPDAGIPVRLKVEDSTDPNKSVETEATVTTAAGWQTLTFNFATQVTGTAALNLSFNYNKATIFFDFGRAQASAVEKTYYFDDITFVPGTPGSGGGGGGGGAGATTSINFEGTAPTFAGFGGAEDASVVTDPTDAANRVARIIKSAGAEPWAGTTISTAAGNSIPRIAFATGNTTITARVWSPVAGIPVRMKVENAADPTQSVETEATVTTASGWQTLSFNFANQAAGTAALNLSTTYTRLSVFFNFGTPGAATGARTYYIDDIVLPSASTGGGGGGGTASTTSINFEGTAPTFAGFGGAEDASVVTDPTDAANRVARIIKSAGAELWAGTTISTAAGNSIPRIAFATGNTTITARVWSPVAGIPVRMKVENAADPTQSVETEATVTTASGWQTLSFNFANQVSGTAALNLSTTYTRLSVFFNFGTPGAATGARTYYIDDIVLPSASTGGGGGGGGTASTTSINFEGTAPTFAGFGGAEDASVVTDPTDAANRVARVIKSAGAEPWAGTTISTAAGNSIPRIAFATGNTTITARVWSPVAGIPVRMKVENAADPTQSVETEATVTTASGWQTLSFNFANQAAGTAALNLSTTYTRLSVFFNFGTPGATTGARTYYIDDIVYPSI